LAHGFFDVHRRQRETFIRPLGGHTKGVEGPLLDGAYDSFGQLAEIRLEQIEWHGMREGKVRDAKDERQAAFRGLITDMFREDDADSAA
jgi:hypothetical protein